jgi:predicted nucleotide-binding protein
VTQRARGVQPDSGILPRLTVRRSELDALLWECIARGEGLLNRPIADVSNLQAAEREFRTWEDYNVALLQRSFSTSQVAEEYRSPYPQFAEAGADPAGYTSLMVQVEQLYENLNESIRRLVSLRGRLDLYVEEVADTMKRPGRAESSGETTIFIVHGRTEAPKQMVARFLGQVTSLKPEILHEAPSAGRTIIEKFEDYAAKAAFAVVLLTADDEGGLLGSGERQRRARQNVVFELGFFIGTLGRARVAVLHEEGVELPSDMSGVLYTSLDPAGAWKLELGRELGAAGVNVDMNNAL